MALQKARKNKHPPTRTKLPEKIKPSRLHFTPDQHWKRWRTLCHSEAALARRCYTAQSTTRRFLRSFETSFKKECLTADRYGLRIGTKTNGGGSGRFGGGPSSGGPSATSLASLPPPKSFASLPSTKAVLAIVSFAVE